MAESGFVFEEGEAVQVGAAGEHDLVFHEGTPVPDTGVSTLVFEQGTGLGGSLQYEINGGGLQAMEPIATAETHAEFYGYSNVSATHGYDEYNTVTLFVHENTQNGSLAIVQTAGEYDVDDTAGTSYEMEFDRAIDGWGDTGPNDGGATTYSDYLLLDGEGGDEFQDTYSLNGWNATATDGWVIDGAAVDEITFTCEEGDRHQVGGGDPDDIRVIYEDGSPPDGGAVEYAGGYVGTEVRIVIP